MSGRERGKEKQREKGRGSGSERDNAVTSWRGRTQTPWRCSEWSSSKSPPQVQYCFQQAENWKHSWVKAGADVVFFNPPGRPKSPRKKWSFYWTCISLPQKNRETKCSWWQLSANLKLRFVHWPSSVKGKVLQSAQAFCLILRWMSWGCVWESWRRGRGRRVRSWQMKMLSGRSGWLKRPLSICRRNWLPLSRYLFLSVQMCN